MTEREQAVEALHRSVRDRISVPLQAYAEALAHWRVVPIRDIDGTIVGAVALDGNEIHVGAYRRPASCQRGLLRRELRETINRYGYAALAGEAATVLNATGVIGGSKGSASPPPLAPPPVMPEPDDAATKAAKRRALAGQAQRQGRQSTILSNDLSSGDLLGS